MTKVFVEQPHKLNLLLCNYLLLLTLHSHQYQSIVLTSISKSGLNYFIHLQVYYTCSPASFDVQYSFIIEHGREVRTIES